MTQHYIEIPSDKRFIDAGWFASQIAACLVDMPNTAPLLVSMEKRTPEAHPLHKNNYRDEKLTHEDVAYLRTITLSSPFWSNGNMTQAGYAEFVEAFRSAPNRPAWELVPYFRDFKAEAKAKRGQVVTKHAQLLQSNANEGKLTLRDADLAPTKTLTCDTLISIKDARAYAEPLGFELRQKHGESASKESSEEPQGDAMPTKTPAVSVDPDEKLAALFDPVPVQALEKMFPAKGKWETWADKAKANGLIAAREGRAKFNPYKAGLWFVRKGADGWDDAHLYRTLVKNLPARSCDEEHLLTSDIG